MIKPWQQKGIQNERRAVTKKKVLIPFFFSIRLLGELLSPPLF